MLCPGYCASGGKGFSPSEFKIVQPCRFNVAAEYQGSMAIILLAPKISWKIPLSSMTHHTMIAFSPLKDANISQ